MADPIFRTPSTNPFGLTDVGYDASPTFADIDDDGDLDAFVGKWSGNTLFYRNTGTASSPVFAAASTNPFGLTAVGFSVSPTFADIDGDGDLDAFVGNSSGNTLFYRNTGTASSPVFAAASTNPFGLTDVGYLASPTFADIDDDGDLDAFVGERYGNTLFFLNTGTASSPVFAAASTNPFGLTDVGYIASPTLVDIDGDGDLDAFVGNSSGNTLFYLNTGTASSPVFAAPSTNPFGLTAVDYRASPTLVDIDGDGDLDAFIGERYGNTLFFRNDIIAAPNNAPSATNLDQTIVYIEDTPATLAAMVVTDANVGDPLTATVTLAGGNSALGSLTASSGKGESYTAATGVWTITGTQTAVNAALAAIVFTPVANGFANTSASVSISDGIAAAITGTLTFNGTAVNDLPTATNLNQTIAYNENTTAAIADTVLTDPDGVDTLTARVTLASGNSALGSLTASSGNGESYTAATGIWTVTGTQTAVNAALAAMSFTPVANSFANTSASVSISDGIAAPITGTLTFNGTATVDNPVFRAPSTNPFGLTDVGSRASPTFADIDDDGDLDAFVGDNYGDTLFYRNTGTASSPVFAARSTNPFGLTYVGSWSSPTFADIDGDGDLDAFVGNGSGNTLFYLNTGTASSPIFAVASTNPFGLTDVGNWSSPTLVDIDGDGDLGAFVGEASGNTLFFRNTGTASSPVFAAPSTNPFGLTDVGSIARPTLVDIDGDGDLDAFIGERCNFSLFTGNTKKSG